MELLLLSTAALLERGKTAFLLALLQLGTHVHVHTHSPLFYDRSKRK